MQRRIIKKPVPVTPEFLEFQHCSDLLKKVNKFNQFDVLDALVNFNASDYAFQLMREIIQTNNLVLWGALFANTCLRNQLTTSDLLPICQTPYAELERIFIIKDPILWRKIHATHLVEAATKFGESEFVSYLITNDSIVAALDKYGIVKLAESFPKSLELLLQTILRSHDTLSDLRKPFWLSSCVDALISCKKFIALMHAKPQFLRILQQNNLNIEKIVLAVIESLSAMQSRLWLQENRDSISKDLSNRCIAIINKKYANFSEENISDAMEEFESLAIQHKPFQSLFYSFNKIESILFPQKNSKEDYATKKPSYA